MTLFGASPHRVTQEYYDALKQRVRKVDLTPGAMTHDEIMYYAGMAKCLEFVEQTIAQAPSANVNRELRA